MSGRQRVPEPVDAASLARIEDQLISILPTLSEREVGVIRLHFGLVDGQPRTVDEIGKVFGVSGQRIRQILKTAMTKLQAANDRAGRSG